MEIKNENKYLKLYISGLEEGDGEGET